MIRLENRLIVATFDRGQDGWYTTKYSSLARGVPQKKCTGHEKEVAGSRAWQAHARPARHNQEFSASFEFPGSENPLRLSGKRFWLRFIQASRIRDSEGRVQGNDAGFRRPPFRADQAGPVLNQHLVLKFCKTCGLEEASALPPK